jgi:hypothetical protein
MLARHKESSAMGFRHLSRPLKPGETPPRLPSLMEQVMACRFVLNEPEPEAPVEDIEDDEDWDEPALDS